MGWVVRAQVDGWRAQDSVGSKLTFLRDGVKPGNSFQGQSEARKFKIKCPVALPRCRLLGRGMVGEEK